MSVGPGPSGQETFQDHRAPPGSHFHSIDVQSVDCSDDGTAATIFGTATIDGAGSVDYRIDVVDNGEPGRNDTYELRLSNGYDTGVQTLVGGNVQVHVGQGGDAAAAASHGAHAAAPTKTARATTAHQPASHSASMKPDLGGLDKPDKGTSGPSKGGNPKK